MIKALLVIISFAIIIMATKSIINEKNRYKFDEILNYKLEEERFEVINNTVEIQTKQEEEIKQLISEGYKDDQICKELNIGRGELLLIKKCYKI